MAKVNWTKMLQEYIADETMSYAKIAAKYGVSDQAVYDRASAENWVQLRKETKEKVRQLLPEKVSESIAEINAQHNQLAKLLIGQALNGIQNGYTNAKGELKKIEPKSFRDVREAISDGVLIQRKAMGMDDKESININFKYEPPSWYKESQIIENDVK